MRKSIRLQIASGFGLLLIIVLVIGLISFRNTYKLQQELNVLGVPHTYEVIGNIEKFLGEFKDAETGQRGYIITNKETYLDPYNAAIIEIPLQLEALRQLTSDNPAQQNRIESLKPLINDKLEELDRTIESRRKAGFDEALALVLSDEGKVAMDNIRTILSEMTQEEYNLLKMRREASDRDIALGKIMIISASLLGLIITLLLLTYFNRSISMPIKRIALLADDISSMNLSIQIEESNRKDEIGILLKAFAKMTGNLKKQSSEINRGINVLTSTISEITATTSELAASSSENASSISQTTSTIEELKQAAELASRKAKEISDNSRVTVDVTNEGEQAVEATSEGMGKISEQMGVIAQSIMSLSEQSQSIGEIMNSINNIAEQSNLLAVNASIEAAKAGEEGKGFSVVASEVKNLAGQSKEATKQVRTILTDIQRAISNAALATEDGNKVVESGRKKSLEAGAAISTLASVIDESVVGTSQIAVSVQQQSVGIEQINEAIRSISIGSTQNLESSKQLNAASLGLEDLANNLKHLMAQYKLD